MKFKIEEKIKEETNNKCIRFPKDLIKEINADGIESNYIYIDHNNNKINEITKWNKVAQELNIMSTRGSDLHTDDNIHPSIGLKSENIQIDNNIVNSLINNLITLKNK